MAATPSLYVIFAAMLLLAALPVHASRSPPKRSPSPPKVSPSPRKVSPSVTVPPPTKVSPSPPKVSSSPTMVSPSPTMVSPSVTVAPPTTAATAWWTPKTSMAFQYQLGKTFDITTDVISGVSVYVVDCFDTPASTVAAMKAKGLFPIGYFSAGSWENWRPDASAFPTAALGKALSGWAGEKWLDVRNTAVRTLMAARIQMCKTKGFLGVDPDNVDGYTNPTGFPLTYADSLSFNTFLANTSHSAGVAVGLKNDVDQVKDLVSYYDYAINEECNYYNECNSYAPFKAANKPVWNIEYTADMSQSAFLGKPCSSAASNGLHSILSDLALDAKYRVPCPSEGTPSITN